MRGFHNFPPRYSRDELLAIEQAKRDASATKIDRAREMLAQQGSTPLSSPFIDLCQAIARDARLDAPYLAEEYKAIRAVLPERAMDDWVHVWNYLRRQEEGGR